MRKHKWCVLWVLSAVLVLAPFSSGYSSDQPPPMEAEEPQIELEGQVQDMGDAIHVPDPLEPYNRLVYQFNDKLYFWVLKPAARGYNKIAPEAVRKSVRNMFSNLTMPIRFVNCGLQGKLGGSAIELTRFFLNTTWGVAGLFDPAKSYLNLLPQEEDFDQTLGKYGLGPGIYLVWPVFGPSSARGTAGLAADMALDPVFYLNFVNGFAYSGVNSYRVVNETSLTLGDYEDLKNAAIDPYVSIRDAYFQNRRTKIQE